MHEYGHCLMARRFNIGTKDITLYIIGGVAGVKFSVSMSPTAEFFIVLAGPLVNLFFILLVLPLLLLPLPLEITLGLIIILTINFILFAFNMLPVFPMDGGRLVRALLCYRFDFYKATYFMVRFSQVFCIFLIILNIVYLNFLTALIFFILMFLSQAELATAKVKMAISNIRTKLSLALNNPKLASADIPEIIEALRSIEDKELRQVVLADDLIPLLDELQEEESGLQTGK
jgi:Zn-dependent protease